MVQAEVAGVQIILEPFEADVLNEALRLALNAKAWTDAEKDILDQIGKGIARALPPGEVVP